jgi:hypothetical protein
MTEEKSDKLYRLVKRLSAEQKGVVFQNLKMLKKETSPLIRLFDEVLNHEHYDTNEIYENLKEEFKTKDIYYSRRNELYNFVLDIASMLFLKVEFIDPAIVKNIMRATFLIEHNLPEDADDALSEARKLADENDASPYSLLLLHLKVLFANRMGIASEIERAKDDLLSQGNLSIEHFADHFPVDILELEAIQYRRQNNLIATPESISFFDSMRNNPALYQAKRDRWFDLKLKHFLANADYYEHEVILRKGYDNVSWREVYLLYKDFLASLNDDEKQELEGNQIRYNAFLNRYTDRSFNYSYKAGEETLRLLLEVRFDHPALELMREAICYHYSLKLSLAKGDLSSFEKEHALFHKSFTKMEAHIDELQRRKTYLYLAVGNLVQGNYKESDWNFDQCLAIHARTPELHIELARFAHIMLAMIGHEQEKSRSSVNIQDQKAKAFLERTGGITAFQETLLIFIKEAAKSSSNEQKMELLRKLIVSLKNFKKEINAINAQFNFHFTAWFESKLGGDRYSERVQTINF